MDETDIARILARSQSDEELSFAIMRYATIVQHLVCLMAKKNHLSEAAIRRLYAAFVDMAVENLADPRVFPYKHLH